jgi:hypothetical protein
VGIYVALATPTQERGPISPDAVDTLDISVVAALLGIDRVSQLFDAEVAAMMRARTEAAAEGRPMPSWDDVGR